MPAETISMISSQVLRQRTTTQMKKHEKIQIEKACIANLSTLLYRT
jgi:hypothetical protein